MKRYLLCLCFLLTIAKCFSEVEITCKINESTKSEDKVEMYLLDISNTEFKNTLLDVCNQLENNRENWPYCEIKGLQLGDSLFVEITAMKDSKFVNNRIYGCISLRNINFVVTSDKELNIDLLTLLFNRSNKKISIKNTPCFDVIEENPAWLYFIDKEKISLVKTVNLEYIKSSQVRKK